MGQGDLGFSPTVRWDGPQTNKRRQPMTGAEFNERLTLAAQSGTINLLTSVTEFCSSYEQLAKNLGHGVGLPREAAALLAKLFVSAAERIDKLEAQVQEQAAQLNLLRNFPPHLAKAERRG